MNLDTRVQSNAVIVSNVLEVKTHCLAQLDKYRGCVATRETIKDDKDACASINKLKKFIADQRIAFDKEVNNQPDVKAVHDALKEIENACDEIRNPYWETVKAIVDADKPKEPTFNVKISLFNITMAQLKKVTDLCEKNGIAIKMGKTEKVEEK